MSFEKKLTRRKKLFKTKSSHDQSRQRRSNLLYQLSNDKRQEQLKKKRAINDSQTEKKPTNDSKTTETNTSNNSQLYVPTMEELPELIKGIKSTNIKKVETSIRGIRAMISVEDNPPIDEIIKTGILEIIVEFLDNWDNEYIQFEAEWILTNTCSGTHEQAQYCVALGIIPKFVSLLNSTNEEVLEQCIWGLGNIAGDCIEFRDKILQESDVIDKIINIFSLEICNLNIAKNAIWSLSNLIRCRPRPELSLIKNVIPIFANYIGSGIPQLVQDSCWGLSYISDGTSENINAVLKYNVVERLVGFLESDELKILVPSLRTIGNIVTGDKEQTQIPLNFKLLEKLSPLLRHKRNQIRQEACWTISNITAGDPQQIQKVIDKGIIPQIIDILENDIKILQIEAVWIISNVCYGGTTKQIKYIIKQGAIKYFVELLKDNLPGVILICLQALDKILKIGENDSESNQYSQNLYVKEVEEYSGDENISRLLNHRFSQIDLLATSLYQEYFYDSTSDSGLDSSDTENVPNNEEYDF
ncbi:importin alpha [Anaeramoeba flamelloides]|uniref:Importin subunit alpha n=1 Tax=Anaeramoeba flamelloides TaxID=1746091 RepID=A0AAV7ZG29_9EUKA|nr:importin alpha [Anaeramoeba flamelloides]KAJ6247868.1 importin alpha [Anaeramoeba flamelloides]